MSDPWGEKLERLNLTRGHYHNDDYLSFLVESVWRLHCPSRLVDFGCGSGYLGVKLLPLMPAGSTYTGIDSSPRLLDQARSVFADAPWDTGFVHADIRDVPLPDGSLGVKMPVLLHKAGLIDIDARVTDAVRCCLPPLDTAEKNDRYEALRADGLAGAVGTTEARQMRERFLEREFSAEETEEESRRATFQAEQFAVSGRELHIVSPLVMVFSFGRVP